MIRARQLHRAFGGRDAVAGVDLEVAAGEVVALMGPNGAGKSTTVRLLLGLLEPDAGTVEITRPVGHLPEHHRPPVQLDVRQVLRFAATSKGLARTAIDEVVDGFELGALLRRPVGRLSRGQVQRVGLAQAFLGQPETLLLDEPSAGLDPAQVRRLRDQVRAAAARGAAVLVCTHVTGDVTSICDRAVILHQGVVRARVATDSAVELEQEWVRATSAVDAEGTP